ncbi:MAG: 2-C-methyl-D-erythritol 4-phosphate cytidylyltransferase, partial [Steroidobacteraceae bacterium]|nr:2-C-methyl-D-erythritol 4-phosphate cytidylyltransferase [Steroidobacteraceae bacterium]
MRYFLVMPAAGSGRRFSASIPKQYAALGAATVIEHSLSLFEADPDCAGIVVVTASDDAMWPAIAARRPRFVDTAPGGAERAQSVRAG